MLVLVLIMILASAVLLAWLLPRASLELRVPKALAAVRGATSLGAASVAAARGRVSGHAAVRRHMSGPEAAATEQPRPDGQEVELAVRERLYGRRPDRR